MNAAPTSALQRTTGHDRAEWFAALDAWGAVGRPYREIAGWLVEEHGLSAWWAQKLAVEYEQERGVRTPGSRRDGTYTVTASKTVAAPVNQLYDAFVDPDVRRHWLPDGTLRPRTIRHDRSARFDWADGAERVNVTFAATGAAKAQVAIEHARLPSEHAAAEAKAFWRARLAMLKTHLES
jgi:Domain of unknown function (DUF4287)